MDRYVDTKVYQNRVTREVYFENTWLFQKKTLPTKLSHENISFPDICEQIVRKHSQN